MRGCELASQKKVKLSVEEWTSIAEKLRRSISDLGDVCQAIERTTGSKVHAPLWRVFQKLSISIKSDIHNVLGDQHGFEESDRLLYPVANRLDQTNRK